MSSPKKKGKTRTYTIAVSTTAKRVCPENPKRLAIYLCPSSGPVLITHGQNIAAAEGYPVTSSTPLKNDTTTSALWVRTASGTDTLYVMEDSEE